MVHVPYISAELATNDLVSGQIQSMFQLVPGALEQIRAGKVKALGIMAPERSDVLPQVPTMSEQGHPRLLSSNWLALLAPTGTPPDVRSEEHTSELQSLMRISYAVFCLKKKKKR